MATIDIVDLRLRTIIGTHPWERKNKQEIIINLSLEYDAQKASRSDRLADALDYEKITNSVIKTVEKSKCQLLEKLAGDIILKLKVFKNVERGFLQIDKPQAIAQAKGISYRISI